MSKNNNQLSLKLSLISVSVMIAAVVAGAAITAIVNDNLTKTIFMDKESLSAEDYTDNIDDSFLVVTSLVDEVAALAKSKITDSSMLANHAEALEETMYKLERIYSVTIKETEFACGYWMILNPNYTGGTKEDSEGDGFFFVKNKDGDYYSHETTNVLNYNPDNPEDYSHVVWWYAIGTSRKEVWTEPYFNGNTETNMISYISPFYSTSGDFLGVLGIDLDFDEITEDVKNIPDYKTAHTMLFDGKTGEIYYHPDHVTVDESGRYIGTNDTVDYVVKHLDLAHDGVQTFVTDVNGKNRSIACLRLGNDMYYGLCVSVSELREPLLSVTIIPIAVFASVGLGLCVLLFFLIRHHLKPIESLIEASKEVEKGNYDVAVKTHNKQNDEINTLIKSFNSMLDSLRSERAAITALAFQDGLTGVQNMNSQEEKMVEINKKIREGKARFAIIMVDVNDLKVINDTYGHVKGDQAIRSVCIALCKTAKNSPVYRVGGDEFIAVLEDSDYEKRDEIVENLVKISTDAEEKINFSVGLATYRPGVDANFTTVYNRADMQMYEMKKKMKEGK